MDDLKQEFWGDLQADLYTDNTAIWLANQTLEQIISTDGHKAHRPIASHPLTGTYIPHNDIEFSKKSAAKQTLTVDTYKYAAEDIDVTEEAQTPYDLVAHSLLSIRKGLMNLVEQKFLSEIANAGHNISGSPVLVSSTNILDILEEAESKLGSVDAPYETLMRALVMGPRTVAKLRRAKADRESRLGDSVLSNGVVGPWMGWIVVQNNNLPWTATLKIATNPTADDTVTIAGVTFKFVASPTNPGDVDIGTDAATSRANLEKAVEAGSGAGTTYIELSERDRFMLTRKRAVTCTSAEDMVFSGYGDISVSETLTAAADVWSGQQVTAGFMIRGAIDVVLQFLRLEIETKEKGFADLPKGVIGIGAKTFYDGADLMVSLTQDASEFK